MDLLHRAGACRTVAHSRSASGRRGRCSARSSSFDWPFKIAARAAEAVEREIKDTWVRCLVTRLDELFRYWGGDWGIVNMMMR